MGRINTTARNSAPALVGRRFRAAYGLVLNYLSNV